MVVVSLPFASCPVLPNWAFTKCILILILRVPTPGPTLKQYGPTRTVLARVPLLNMILMNLEKNQSDSIGSSSEPPFSETEYDATSLSDASDGSYDLMSNSSLYL